MPDAVPANPDARHERAFAAMPGMKRSDLAEPEWAFAGGAPAAV